MHNFVPGLIGHHLGFTIEAAVDLINIEALDKTNKDELFIEWAPKCIECVAFDFQPGPEIMVKGKRDPVRLFSLSSSE